MKVTGEHQFRLSRDQVWAGLQDPQILAASVPGARRLEPTGPDEYAITVDVGVGSVKGPYEGTFALTDKQDGEACTVRASASGRPGSVDAVAQMRLADRDGGVLLTYEADATVTGPLAGVGQRLMGAAARRTTEQFLSALEETIVSPPAPEAEAAAAPAAERRGAEIVVAPRGGADTRVVVGSALAGFVLALIGVAVGRWTARR
jgi:carbon monoxide dehydrogenase subunit G